MLVYIEYISRRPGNALEAFHAVQGRGHATWADAYSGDRLILDLGRTWRIGPEPEYLTVWYNADAGLDRLDAWAHAFTSNAGTWFEAPSRLVARIDAGNGRLKPSGVLAQAPSPVCIKFLPPQ